MLMSLRVAYNEDVMGCISATIKTVNMQLKHCIDNMDISNVMCHGIPCGRSDKKDSISVQSGC